MASTLIKMNDGTLVEVEALNTQIPRISGASAEVVGTNLDRLHPLLVRLCGPIGAAWGEIKAGSGIESAEVEVGLSFEASGELYITKSRLDANLTVKYKLRAG